MGYPFHEQDKRQKPTDNFSCVSKPEEMPGLKRALESGRVVRGVRGDLDISEEAYKAPLNSNEISMG